MRYATVPESHAAHEASMVVPEPVQPPAPLYTSQDTQAWDCWPPAILALRKVAIEAGWDVRVGFSRGYVPGRAGGTLELVDMLGVWVDGFGMRGGAFWERKPDSETASGYAWKADSTIIRASPLLAGFPYANHTEFRVWLKAQGRCAPSWFAMSRERVMAARAKAKAAVPAKAKTRENGG